MAGGIYVRGFITQGLLKVEPAVSITIKKVAAYGAFWSALKAGLNGCSPPKRLLVGGKGIMRQQYERRVLWDPTDR
jgi:hypothetical protein